MFKFTVHAIVKNEDIWASFAIKAILPFADQIMIYDTGSTDRTAEIIKSIHSPKIVFWEKGEVDKKGLVRLRNEQIKKTRNDWFLIVDGDEVWPNTEVKKLIKAADSAPSKTVALVNRSRNCIGDVYHYLPESAGKYQLAGVAGNLNIRMIKKTVDLKVEGDYPWESYANNKGPIEKQTDVLQFVDCWCLHASFLKRSSLDNHKTSGSFGKRKFFEKGIKIDSGDLPEVLFDKQQNIVSDPLTKRSFGYELVSFFSTPILSFKRKLNLAGAR